MIVCNNCGYRGAYKSTVCPQCNKKITLSQSEVEERREEINRALSKRSYERAIENYEILADFGDAEAQRELAKLLEHGELINRDLDRAMKYFRMAAEQNDPYSAYRYSRLASRTSDTEARFWLIYSAILGCKEAYSAAAEQFSYEGDEISAHYYYALAAEDGDADAIVTLARRYCDGIGTEPSEAHAKWYLDQLALPPIHAIKLAYRLRAVDAVEPPKPCLENEDAQLRSLAGDAEKYKFATAFLHINEMLADKGYTDALTLLGMLHAEGVGCEKNLVIAVEYLERAAAEGSAQAFYYLGELFTTGKSFEVDINRALDNYTAAAEHGYFAAYETMGDIFREGKFIARDLARAIDLYDKAAEELESAKKKSEELRHKRETFFRYAKEAEHLDPVQCFRNCAISTAMGYTPATRMLAHLYEVGRGTKKDRGRAFLWYKTAAEAGDEYAYYDIGRCYAYGIGTAFDYELALKSFRTAEAAGYTTAKREIERLESNRKRRVADKHLSTAMRLLYKKKFKAAKCYLDLCMLLENPKAIYTLGCLYEFGLGVEVNKDYAYGLYEEAYKMKFRDPRAKYKLRVLKLVR